MKLPKIPRDALVGHDSTGAIKAGRITRSEQVVDIADPNPATIDIYSIASGLAYQGRFTGQTRVYYDLARHSMLVSYLVPPALALKALLHDADEAYINDMSRPAKPLLPDYKKLQAKWLAAVMERFGFKLPLGPEIAQADHVAVALEQAYLLPDSSYWPRILSDESVRTVMKEAAITPGFFLAANPELSRVEFLRRYFSLGGKP